MPWKEVTNLLPKDLTPDDSFQPRETRSLTTRACYTLGLSEAFFFLSPTSKQNLWRCNTPGKVLQEMMVQGRYQESQKMWISALENIKESSQLALGKHSDLLENSHFFKLQGKENKETWSLLWKCGIITIKNTTSQIIPSHNGGFANMVS